MLEQMLLLTHIIVVKVHSNPDKVKLGVGMVVKQQIVLVTLFYGFEFRNRGYTIGGFEKDVSF